MKKCAFCTRSADSREHIFSDWMLDMLPSGERFTFNERNVNTGEYVKYGGRKIQLKAKVVCTRCNNEWMSDMEDKVAKPAMANLLFSEDRALLDTKVLGSISIFAFKTLVIANHKDLRTMPFFPSAQRIKFRRELVYPTACKFGWRPAKSSGVDITDFGSRSRGHPTSHPVLASPVMSVPGIFKTWCFKSSASSGRIRGGRKRSRRRLFYKTKTGMIPRFKFGRSMERIFNGHGLRLLGTIDSWHSGTDLTGVRLALPSFAFALVASQQGRNATSVRLGLRRDRQWCGSTTPEIVGVRASKAQRLANGQVASNRRI